MESKLTNIESALAQVNDGDVLMVGGFGLIGAPLSLIDHITTLDLKELTVISNNVGEAGKGLGLLLDQGKLKKAVGSYFTSNREVAKWYNAGKLELQLLPQGTLSEAIRAGGAGLGGFYTKTAVGTDLAEGKETKEIDGETYVFEKALKADVALIRAHKADTLGNLVYYKTARNFNPMMATAAKYVVAEVEEIVEPGELNPEEIATQHLYVDKLVLAEQILTKDGVVQK
ncbi:CoA transferase subunit A [Salinicoccus roseus]|uniref:CoA transferase subunit A n=1 Tax=Salinicoccus roseus TaxID=45670 RepID=A0A0C2H952_9STAP|nr:CoA transferase subunit A [Salinicoccus roseus]KIH70320.1 succinyl-CoA:3-ketoacid-CoA transferase [Salinicoccus roseus]MDB0580861.1 CoA transferase subunit A [Salinicoccus roseus]